MTPRGEKIKLFQSLIKLYITLPLKITNRVLQLIDEEIFFKNMFLNRIFQRKNGCSVLKIRNPKGK